MENTTPAPTLGQRIRNSISNIEVEIEKKKEELQQLFGRKAAFHDLLATAEAVGHDLEQLSGATTTEFAAPAAADMTPAPAADPAPTPAN